MQTVHTVAEAREITKAWRRSGDSIGLVPTMGNLHEGHASLVNESKAGASHVVVSIFVNPTQFGPTEDLDSYPRTPDRDAGLCRRLGVDLIFAPGVSDMYPGGIEDTPMIVVPGLSEVLCGASRPGHFSGVATIVNKLFNIVQPDTAFFGEKDYQQLVVIKRFVEALCLPVDIVGVSTHRQADGLATSSRNQYLSTEERQRAPELYRSLCEVAEALRGGSRSFHALETGTAGRLEKHGFRPDYVAVRRASDLGEPSANDEDLVVLAAATIGKARLIDNVRV